MTIHYTTQRTLTEEARNLVEFDTDSIRQVVVSQGEREPSVWVANPDGYQSDDHVLRDSESIRLIAYVPGSETIYATDGCNACRHTSDFNLAVATDREREEFSARTQLPVSMLRLLGRLVADSLPPRA